MKNLEGALHTKRIPSKAIADMLGITEKTFRNKMQGITDFTWGEILKIKALFPEYEINYLFERQTEAS